MAQTKKTTQSAKKKKNTSTKRTNKSNARQLSLFGPNYKKIISMVFLFVSLFMGAVVFIDAGSVWGMLRNFFFGVFGIFAFIIPFFVLFASVVALIGKDTSTYKKRVVECTVVFLLLAGFCHIVVTDSSLEYSKQISEAYKVYKTYTENGMHYGYGVMGALFGGIPLLLTGGSKLAAGAVNLLFLLAFSFVFFGTTFIKLFMSLKKPAEVVSDYAEEKIADFRETYETVSEDIHEKRAKNAEKRRSTGKKHELDLNVTVDDAKKTPDDSVEPILKSEQTDVSETYSDSETFSEEFEKIELLNEFEESPPVDAPSLDELFATKAAAQTQFENVTEILKKETVTDEETLKTETDSEVSETSELTDNGLQNENTEEFFVPEDVSAQPEIQYELPNIGLLNEPKKRGNGNSPDELKNRGETIVKTLKSFGVGTRIVEICQSPSVTRFELQPDPGVKISRITALSDDIAMNLAASGVRIEAPIPNKNAVGIEVPNSEKVTVTLREIIESDNFRNSKSKLNVALGRDIQGDATCADLSKMPHLLVAGTTGSGKSVCLNTIIMSLLFNATPDEVKLIMIDPKKVEFTAYRSIPHLLVPVVADPRKAAGALSWAVAEMDKRYAVFAEKGARNLQGYNSYAVSEGIAKMPQIVIIIDELSDLMMAASNEVEDSICRLAQKARAAGMHLIVATQRPSVDVITGLIKSNIPSRIAFAVKSQIDSRTIIDTQGAEKLLGNGDMLFCPVGLSKPVRVQGAYVSDDEIERVIDFVTSQSEVKYDDDVMHEIELKATKENKKKSTIETDENGAPGYDDEMFPKAVEVVVENGMASTTLLQRKLKLGYARAARIVDELTEKGIIGPYEGAKPRKVLITKEQWYQMQANSQLVAPKQLSLDDVAPQSNDADSSETPPSPEEHNYFGAAVSTSENEGL